MMSNINPSSLIRTAGVGNGRMTGQFRSTYAPPFLFFAAENVVQQLLDRQRHHGATRRQVLRFYFSSLTTSESSRPSSTNPYTSSSLSFDRQSAGTPWGPQQSTSLDPSDFPALGSGTSNVHHGPPSSQSYASTAGTGAQQQQQQRLQQQMFGRQGSTTDDSGYNLSSGPFSQDEFPALGGINEAPPQQQRQGGLPGHLTGAAGGQANGVYDPRQHVGQQLMTPPPNLQGSQSLQQAQEHRASMLEALQSGQRPPPRQPVLGGTSIDN